MEDKKVITVPDGWEDVTLKQYKEIVLISSNEDLKEEEKFIEIAAVLIDEDPELIKNLNIKDFTLLLNNLKWTNEMPSDAIYKPIIKIDNIEYGLIDNFTKFTVGEWHDLEHFLKEPINNIDKIFSILYRPLLVAYNDRDRVIENYDANIMPIRANLFNEKMTIGNVYGALVFFSHIAINCIQIIAQYLEKDYQLKEKIEEQMNKMKN